MKIVYLAMIPRIGGAERGLLNLLRGIRQLRPSWQLTLVVPEEGPLSAAAAELGATIRQLDIPGSVRALGESEFLDAPGKRALIIGRRLASAAPGSMAYLLQLRRLLAAERPEVVHSNGIKLHLIASLAVPRAGRLVWHVQDFVATRPLSSRLLRLVARRPDLVVTVSNQVTEEVRDELRCRWVETLYNGIELSQFTAAQPNTSRLDQLAGFPPATGQLTRIGLIGTYARWKGHDVFLKAIAELTPAERSTVRAYVIGGAIYETRGSQYTTNELRSLARELGIADHVGFVPFQDQVAELLRSLDIVVHASTRPEPFGNVVVEGMAAGCAVIAAGTGGVQEIFTPMRDAIPAEPANPAAIASAIRRLLADAALRQELQRAGRERARRFEAIEVAGRMVSLYERLRGGHDLQ